MYTARLILLLTDFIFGLIELIIGLRIIFKMFGANPSTPFVSWLYEVSRTLLYPFQSIFPSPVLRGGFVLDMSAVVALLIYALIAYFISELIRFTSYNSSRYSTSKDEESRKK
ncbi:MAG: YggT family protein [Patescibacteria group bacterium]|nr:YggT family protein [Patescibacteria group bacterium]